MEQLTLGSLFDGIGGFPLAGLYAGIRPIWASEIEPFPIRVTRKRLPFMRHYGDIHTLHGGMLEPVGIIAFGSPCQNLSVAGKRAGLNGEQSSLFFEAVRIIREMREATNGIYPRWAVWENVPGALSSNAGQDFREVLTRLVRIKDAQADVPMPENGVWLAAGEILGDHYSLAWRIIDAAKGWGVAQRRKRIFIVLDLDGASAGKILFESEGVSRYSPPGAEAGQGTADGTQESAGKTGEGIIVLNDQGGQCMDVTENVAATLRAQTHGHPPIVLNPSAAVMFENHSQDTRYTGPLDVAPTVSATYGMGGNNQPFIVEKMYGSAVTAGGFCTEHSADSRGIGYEMERSPTLRAGVVPGVAIEFNPTASRIEVKEDGVCQTLTARMGTGGNNTPLTMQPIAYGISSDQSNAMLSDNPHSGVYEAETSRTLDQNGGNPCCNQGGVMVVERKQPTFSIDRAAFNQGENALYKPKIDKEIAATIVAKGPGAVARPDDEYLVRRLTPDECCRLQGYPDGWCKGLISENPTDEEISFWMQVFEDFRQATGGKGKPKSRNQIVKWLQSPGSDSAEYKAYGNSVAVPCVFFVLAGIAWVTEQGGESD